mgnify:CR=1 FL=1
MHRAGPGFGFQRCSSLKFPTDFSRLQELFGGGLVLSTVVPLSWFVRPTCPLRRLFVRSVSGYSFVCSSSGCAVGVFIVVIPASDSVIVVSAWVTASLLPSERKVRESPFPSQFRFFYCGKLVQEWVRRLPSRESRPEPVPGTEPRVHGRG